MPYGRAVEDSASISQTTMTPFPKPRVLFSRCLTFEACRYNGQIIASEAVEQFKPLFENITVCPEAEIGLGIPREPIRIVREKGGFRLQQPATGRDVSDKMRDFGRRFLDALGPVDGFVLKGRSPSCGLTDVKVFAGTSKGSPLPGRTAGFFGQAVLERFPDIAVEDEGRLTNFVLREHFLTRVYATARFRLVLAEGSKRSAAGRLVRFHAENKLLLMGYNQTKMRELGRLVANPEKQPAGEVLRAYGRLLGQALARPPRHASAVNVLEHGYGYFKDRLTSREKTFFRNQLDSYRNRRVPLSVPQSIIRAWVERFDETYLAEQTFFRPYPEELALISDSGKGREL